MKTDTASDQFAAADSTKSTEGAEVEEEQMSATGFFIFTIISGLMACYILYSVFSTCTRYQELSQRSRKMQERRVQDRHLLSLKSTENTSSSAGGLSLQGLKCKSLFFVSLFLICLLRTFCLVFITLKYSELNKNVEDDAPLNILIHLLLDLPTLILISVFSAFAYYLSSLNMEVETIMQEMDAIQQQQNQGGQQMIIPRSQRSTSTAAIVGGNQEQFLQVHGEQIRENTTGFAKMFFIIANLVLTIFYFVCFVKYQDDIRAGESDMFDKWVRTFTGISFLILGVSILKYGSQLETTITHASTLKTAIAKQMEGLDLRILSITILLSLVFLSRALVDCMFAFNLINEQLNSFVVLLCIVVFSEVCTSVAVVRLMKKGERKAIAIDASIDNHFKRMEGDSSKNKLSSARGAHQKTNTRTGDQDSGSAKDQLNNSYSSYGSFNPNRDSQPFNSHQALLSPAHDSNDHQLMSSGTGNKFSKNYSQYLAAHQQLKPHSLPPNKHVLEGGNIQRAKKQQSKVDVFGMPIDAINSSDDSDNEAPLFN